MPAFRPQELSAFGQRVLHGVGVPDVDARLTAEMLVQADLQGYSTHGIGTLPDYVQRIRDGLVRPNGQPRVVRDAKATALIDGERYLGQVVGSMAMNTAI